MKAFLDGNLSLPCECRGSLFADKDNNHIVTGNFKTINSNELHKFFSEGSKHHENRTADCQKAKGNYNYRNKIIYSILV